ncbi:helix-turn-helix domain-containing protein [uncultured Phenylobacterium sp.]|uniref:helix-turn-helix transcriptional regulator n=1 Tax=uncultured Phenylobacterium sp. TaxID=349273 RepID=UPI0025FDF4F3|nr:helix-turn-helix domain-containing protein [uncultured Phenylobacterium sp.]
MDDELLDTEQVAKGWGFAEVTLRKWRMTGDGPRFMRLGRAIRYRRADLEDFLVRRAFSTTTEADMASAETEAA